MLRRRPRHGDDTPENPIGIRSTTKPSTNPDTSPATKPQDRRPEVRPEVRPAGHRRFAGALLLLLAASSCASEEPPPDGEAVVLEVIDGDTIVARYGPHQETVRLLGIDTPETKHPDKPIECWGPEASRLLEELLPPGTAVYLSRDIEARDNFGRLLAWVTTSAGVDIQATLIDQGAADVLSIEPNLARRQEMIERRDVARSNHLGMWGGCNGLDSES